MGTDIHLEVERLGDDQVWHWIEHPDRPCDYEYCEAGKLGGDIPNKDMVGADCWRCKGTGHYVDQFWDDRNYDTFAILADVRNGAGFAGVDTGDGFVPIAMPRGLPDDLSDEIRRSLEPGYFDWDTQPYEEWKFKADVGEHSQSWLLVSEILNYDWTQTTHKRGVVGPGEFQQWREHGSPRSWSGGVSGGGVHHVSNEEMARMIDDGTIQFTGEADVFDGPRYTVKGEHAEFGGRGPTYYTTVEWEVTYEESARRFLKVLFRDIVPLGDPDRLRLVFGFDS